jgi:phage tail-like protein
MSFGKFEIKLADGTTTVVELTKRQMVVGRAADADVPINDNMISRRHAVLLCGPEGVRIVDEGSANGTYLSGAKLPAKQPVPLSDGAQLRMGQALIKFVAAKAEEADATSIKAAAAEPPPTTPPVKPSPSARAATTAAAKPATPPAAAAQSTAEAVAPKADQTSIKKRPPTSGGTPAFGGPPAFGAPPDKPTELATEPEPEPEYVPPIGMPTDQSSYLKYMPTVYGTSGFIGRFLLIFESILTPVDRQIGNLPYYFDPRMAPPDFLPWLAGWLGLVLDERWPEGQRRELIRSAVDLYDWRGTRRGVSEFLRLYTGYLPEIVEPGVGAKSAKTDQAFRFIVRIKTPEPDKVNRELVQTIIEMEKPAQAGYTLEVIGEK